MLLILNLSYFNLLECGNLYLILKIFLQMKFFQAIWSILEGPLSSTLPSVQHKKPTLFKLPKFLSSTPKPPQFNTSLSSKPKIPQFKVFFVLNWEVCWTKGLLVLNWGALSFDLRVAALLVGAQKVLSLSWTDVLN